MLARHHITWRNLPGLNQQPDQHTSLLQAACQMLMHGDHELECVLLNISNPDWQQQVEQQAVAILAMVCLDFTGKLACLAGM